MARRTILACDFCNCSEEDGAAAIFGAVEVRSKEEIVLLDETIKRGKKYEICDGCLFTALTARGGPQGMTIIFADAMPEPPALDTAPGKRGRVRLGDESL